VRSSQASTPSTKASVLFHHALRLENRLTDKQVNLIGTWDTAQIMMKGKRVEHWLNGKKVLEYVRVSEAFRNIKILDHTVR
jgi:hypothetical protein